MARAVVIPEIARPVAKTPLSVVTRQNERMARDARIEVARQSLVYFVAEYMTTEDGSPFDLQPFHVEMLDTCEDESIEREMFLEPASFGKSTHVVKHYAIWKLCCDPNIRIALGGKTFDDATRRLRTIKQELESNEKLIRDFGPFKGEVWKEDQITVVKRTANAKEATITCFGSETNVFGWRSDLVILDDIVTNDNSGPQVKPATRERLRDNFFQGVMKMGTVGKKFLVRWVNTVVDLRDLTHEIGLLKDHPDMNEIRWKTPAGWTVIRRSAINETTGEPLWPQVYDNAKAEQERASDPLMFLKRMQNRCIEPELMTFQKVWIDGNGANFPGCLDHMRSLGDCPPGWTTAGGFDPAVSLGEKADYSAHVVLAFDKQAPEPRIHHVIWLDRGRWELDDQQQRVVDAHRRFNSSKTKVEANAAQQWFLSSGIVKKETANPKATINGAMRIEPHYTKATNKPDPEIGIPSLAGMVKMGLLRFPMGDANSLRLSNLLISGMLEHPMGHSDDLLMALWFAVLAARESYSGRVLRVVKRVMPDWSQGVGLGREFAQTRGLIRR